MPCVVDLNFQPFLPFLLFDFPLSESFQRWLLICPHLSRGCPRDVCGSEHWPYWFSPPRQTVPLWWLSPPLPAAGSPAPTHSFINPFHSLLVCSHPLQRGEKIAILKTNRNSSSLWGKKKSCPFKYFVLFEVCLCADEAEVSCNGVEASVLGRDKAGNSSLFILYLSVPVPLVLKGMRCIFQGR